MSSWARVALQHNQELHPPTDGSAPRTLDGAIASVVEADGGHALSHAEFDHFIRDYVASHPAATDRQVVEHAAAHNGHDATYPAAIWRHFQDIRRESAVPETAPAAAPTTAAATTGAPPPTAP